MRPFILIIALPLLAALAACLPAASASLPPAPTAPPPAVLPPATAAPVPTSDTTFTFGLIMVGARDDHGWSEAQYVGGHYVEQNVPGTKMVWLDKVNPADRKDTTFDSVVQDMMAHGAHLILATSDDFKDDTLHAAQKYPDVTFIHVSGDDVLAGRAPQNEGNVMSKMEYGKMIAGCAAALTSNSGKLGYLGPLANDETRRLSSAAFLGARYCWTKYRGRAAQDLTFAVQWIGYWFNIPGITLDPTVVANDFFNSGADVVISGIDTTEALVEAGKRVQRGERVFAIPYDYREACSAAPQACLGVPYFNWGPAYADLVRQVRGGEWKSGWVWLDPDWNDILDSNTSAVGFAPGEALAPADKATLAGFIRGLGDSSIQLFKGPLNLQDGAVYLGSGVAATDKQIWYLPKLLEGMTGLSAPQ